MALISVSSSSSIETTKKKYRDGGDDDDDAGVDEEIVGSQSHTDYYKKLDRTLLHVQKHTYIYKNYKIPRTSVD